MYGMNLFTVTRENNLPLGRHSHLTHGKKEVRVRRFYGSKVNSILKFIFLNA